MSAEVKKHSADYYKTEVIETSASPQRDLSLIALQTHTVCKLCLE